MSKRLSLQQRYGDRYKLVNGERGPFYNLCVYCGRPATCRDHVPPLNRVSDYESMNLRHEMYLLVPSCTQCNTALSDSLQETIQARVEHLKDILSAKFKKTLGNAEWDDDEIMELGPTLRSYVAVETAKDINLAKRVNYYGGIQAVLDSLSVTENVKNIDDFLNPRGV